MLALTIVFHFTSSFHGLSILAKTMTIVIVPALLLVYFYKEKIMANVFFAILILAFMGSTFSAFGGVALFSKFSQSSFLGAYVLIVFVMLGKLKEVKFEGLVSWYLMLILIVNTYLMYVMFASVKDNFQDSVVLSLTISKGIALLIMGFLAFAIYLSQESAQSILFLMAVCCFVFSDILAFITSMYVDYWVFAAFHNILQAMGLFLFVLYVYNHHQNKKVVVKIEKSNASVPANPMTVQS